MEIIIGLVIMFFALVLWIVFVPIHLRVDTSTNLYELNQKGTICMSLHPGEKRLLKIWVLGFPITASGKPKSEKKKEERKRSKPFLKRSFSTWLFLLKGMIKSIRIKRLICAVDFNDFVLNSQLSSILFLFNRGPVCITINFNRYYYFNLEMEGKLHKLIWAFILFLTKK